MGFKRSRVRISPARITSTSVSYVEKSETKSRAEKWSLPYNCPYFWFCLPLFSQYFLPVIAPPRKSPETALPARFLRRGVSRPELVLASHWPDCPPSPRGKSPRRTLEIAASISGNGISTATAIASNVMPENLSCPKMMSVATYPAERFASARFFVTKFSTRPAHVRISRQSSTCNSPVLCIDSSWKRGREAARVFQERGGIALNLECAGHTEEIAIEGLSENGFGQDQLVEMQKIIDAEDSDLFDVLLEGRPPCRP